MDRSRVIYLIKNDKQKNQYGVWVDNTTERKVFAEVTSVGQSEWFEGGRQGLNPQLRFRMFAYDYQGESLLKYNNTIYSIYRTYVDKDEIIELYTELKKGV
jgi:hypothetical protein